MIKSLLLTASLAATLLTNAQVPETEGIPVATVGGFRSGEKISKESLSAQAGVGVYVYVGMRPTDEQKKAASKSVYTITGFRASVMRNGVSLFTSENKGNVFNEKTKAAFGDLKPGDVVLISEISVAKKGAAALPAGSDSYPLSVLYEIK